MNKLMQRSKNRQELFDNTIRHFNSENRAVTITTHCKYRTDGKACAIGREISDELAEKLDNQLKNAIYVDEVFELLPIRLKRMGQGFLNAIQRLHDDATCWDKDGLSSHGVRTAKNIAKDYKLMTYTFEEQF